MTDKEILEEVYKMCRNPFERWGYPTNLPMSDVKSFIEQEWQNQDHPLTKSDEGQMYNIQIANNEIENVVPNPSKTECHRGLEISPDGTVTKLI